jgi:hypothetical protein
MMLLSDFDSPKAKFVSIALVSTIAFWPSYWSWVQLLLDVLEV